MKKYSYLLLVMLFSMTASAQKKDTLCTNLLDINSKYDDYQPHWLEAEKTLLFTSNRRNAQESQSTQTSEKVYFSTDKSRGRNNRARSNDAAQRKTKKRKSTWTPPRKNGYTWNSDNNTTLTAVSPANFYFYRSYWQDNGEIFTAKRIADKRNPWRASSLKRVRSINSEYDECSVAPVGNSDSLYFVSNRDGNYDIYLQVGRDIQALDKLNTPYMETDLFYRRETRTLYFSSNRPDGYGGFDIYEAVMTNGAFTEARLIADTMINTPADDRDFRRYNDSLMFFSSNREGGAGGFDIYRIQIITEPAPKLTAEVEKEAPVDSIAGLREELYEKLQELGLEPFLGEIQVGAFRYIKSLPAFRKKFPCFANEDVRMDMTKVDGVKVHKFIIDTVYNDVDEAINKQVNIEAMRCLPHSVFTDMPFIAMLDKDGNRYAIFWKKDEFVNKNIFYIFKNGKQVWKNKLF